MWNKIKDFFSIREDELYDSREVVIRGENLVPFKKNGTPAHSTELAIMHPSSFSDALVLIRLLQNRSAILINITQMDDKEAQRLVDFLSGSAYALDGYQTRVGEGVFLIAPSNVAIHSGEKLVSSYGVIGKG